MLDDQLPPVITIAGGSAGTTGTVTVFRFTVAGAAGGAATSAATAAAIVVAVVALIVTLAEVAAVARAVTTVAGAGVNAVLEVAAVVGNTV